MVSDPGGMMSYAEPNAALLRRWAAWLRAHPERQVRNALRRRLPDGRPGVCALGALEEIAAHESWVFWPGRQRECLRMIVRMNDELGWSFPDIARWLEQIASGQLDLETALALRHPAELDRPRRPRDLTPSG